MGIIDIGVWWASLECTGTHSEFSLSSRNTKAGIKVLSPCLNTWSKGEHKVPFPEYLPFFLHFFFFFFSKPGMQCCFPELLALIPGSNMRMKAI